MMLSLLIPLALGAEQPSRQPVPANKTVPGWRTGGAVGVAHLGGEYDVGAGVALTAAFDYVRPGGPLGVGFAYLPSFHDVDENILVLHQLRVSPRLTRVTPAGRGYQYVGLDGIIGLWDLNYPTPGSPATTSHASSTGTGFGASAGGGMFVSRGLGLDLSAAYSLVWFADPRDAALPITRGRARAGVVRVTVGLWFKGR